MRLFTILSICVATLVPTSLVLAQSASSSDSGDATYTLTVNEDTFEVGDAITVAFTNSDNTGGPDWIGLFRLDASDSNYQTWRYVSGSEGSTTFTIAAPGEYEFRYFRGSGYELLATSEVFSVTTPDDGGDNGGDDGDDGGDDDETYTLSLSKTEVSVGESVTVSYDTSANNVSSNWIGLFRADANNGSYLAWRYVTSQSGEATFTMSQTGEYEIRYFLASGYEQVAVSETITVTSDDGDDGDDGGDETYTLSLSETDAMVGDQITVTYDNTAANSGSDWIGLFETDAGNSSYTEWQYVSGQTGEVVFVIERAGDYEFRYFAGDYVSVAVSETVTVLPNDDDDGGDDGDGIGYSLTTDVTNYERGATAFVTWDVPSGESFFLNWIGLYEPEADDNEYLDFEYVDIFSRTETFRLDNDGFFEFRFFTNNSYNQVAVSDRITVFNDTNASCNIDTSDITNFPPQTGPIIAFGDSLTEGVGATAGEDYVSELEDRLNISIVNEGVSGDNTRDALARLQTDVLSQNPSAVIVFLGGNDEIRRFYDELSNTALRDELDELAARIGYDWMDIPLIPRDETFANIESIIEQIQAAGAVTILVGFDTSIYDATIDDDYRAIAENTNSFFVPDIFDGVFGRPRFMSDLVHPNNAGYDFFADRIQPAVACVLP